MYPWTDARAWKPKEEGKRIPSKILIRCGGCGRRYWSQKNIGWLGARSLFHHAGGCEWMREQYDGNHECACDGDLLEIDEELMAHIVDCEACAEYGY